MQSSVAEPLMSGIPRKDHESLEAPDDLGMGPRSPSGLPLRSAPNADRARAGGLVRPATLGDLFATAGINLPSDANAELAIRGLVDDSRQVAPGFAYLAVRGEAIDGHRFIRPALEQGAAVVIAERVPEGVDASKVVIVRNTQTVRGFLAHAYWGRPSDVMTMVGVTGTNGKTTTAYLIESLLRQAGRRPALFSTVEYRFGERRQPAPTTTPGAFQLARALAETRALGADAAVMEVSSHALAQRRVDGVQFEVGLMTNLTQDHLDYHATMEEYAEAKRLLFTRHKPRTAVFNLDDPTARRFAEEFEGSKVTYSLTPDPRADVGLPGDADESLKVAPDGIKMMVRLPPGRGERARSERARSECAQVVRSPLRGRFNASNLLAAAAAGVALGFAPETIAAGLEKMPGAPGRFERVDGGQPFAVYVDYAHTPDAVQRVLENVRPITRGRVIVVQGCGGDRDPGKRPKMGAAVGQLADYGIITNDNPRTEDPERIARAMEEGIRTVVDSSRYEICLDRREAIRRAISMAQAGDSVVIGGKGHEDYQEIQGQRRHFDDREVALEFCRGLYGGDKAREKKNHESES